MQYDQHTNLTFFAIEDLEALDCYLSLTLSSLEALDKEETSPDPYWKHIKEIYEFLDELQTLEEGDPPGERSLAARSMRDVMPELRDKARKAIRVKAQDRVLAVVLDVPEDNEE